MEINPLGITAASTTLLSIWGGHVAVRKAEAVTVELWKPMVVAFTLGLALETAAFVTPIRPISTILGILGMTLFWDVLEIKRQARRVRKGYAPANPNNRRHAAILAEPGTHAITLNVLDRDPVGRTVDLEEAIQLVVRHGV